MALQFNETTGLLLDLNKIDKNTNKNVYNDNQDFIKSAKINNKELIKDNKKETKLLIKSNEEYSKKINDNIKKLEDIQKNKKTLKDNKKENTASEKAKELQPQKKEVNQKIEVKIPAEEIGEVVGNAYYESYKEIKSFFSSFIESGKSILQFLSSKLFQNDKDKDIKNASEKTIKNNKNDNSNNKEILKVSKTNEKTNEKILKYLKHLRNGDTNGILSKIFSKLGLLDLLKKIVKGLLPLEIIRKLLEKVKLLDKLNKRKPNKKKNNNRKPNNNNNNKQKNKKTKKRPLDIQKQERKVKKRQVPKSRTRIKIPEKLEKKAGLKVATKVGGKVLTKFIPFVGEALMLVDALNTAKDVYNGKGVINSFKSNFLGLDTEEKEKPKLTKKQLVKIKDTQEAIKNCKSVLTPTQNKLNTIPTNKINRNLTWMDYTPTQNKTNQDKEIKVVVDTSKQNNETLSKIDDLHTNLIKKQDETIKVLKDILIKNNTNNIIYKPNLKSLKEYYE